MQSSNQDIFSPDVTFTDRQSGLIQCICLHVKRPKQIPVRDISVTTADFEGQV